MLSTRENYSCEKSSMSGIQPTTSNFDSSINKQSSSSRTFNMLEEEIIEGNCLIVDKRDVVDEKINTTPKKRFFDLKRSAESATNKIKSPSRFLLNNLTPKLRRKSAANHKLSQLEQHGNLFIRERGSEEEERTNNNPETLMSDVSMENGAAVANTKNQQTTIISNSSGMSKLNKISLIPSFISPNRNKMKQQQPTEFPNYEEIDIETIAVTETFLNEENFNEMMSKTDLMSSNVQEMLKNIPVRQRKSAVPHMENYCLFDPAVDFYNEKELRKNNFATADFCFPKFSNLPRVVQYDVTEHDDRIALFHNYYEIDPELLEKDENNRIVGNEECTRESTSSSSSCDYPSTDDNANADNLISCNATGAKRKYLPQMERIVRKEITCNSANNSPRKSNNFDPLKASHSLPQLETVECNNSQQLPIAFETHKSARKTRPLSSDSGFTTPSPPNECQMKNLNSVRVSAPTAVDNKNESTVLNQCDNIQQLIEIYTEWANYYLEKHKSKRKVVDLSADARDGLLLAEIIEAVTSFKVPDLIKKPKNQQQMYDNVDSCLLILRQNAVPGVENISTNDIISGRLKAILSLFFSLSRYKQATSNKLKPPVRQLHSHDMMLTKERQLPVYTKTANGATAIPMPATVLVTRRCPPDKVRPLPPTPNHQSSLTKTASGSPSNESSRPNSPPDNTSKNGIRGSKIPSGPYSTQNGSNVSLLTNANLQQQEQIQQAQQTPTKQSMLGKLKLFAGKEKSSIESPKTQLSKRTSSSSGFSSARSERSDSSISLNNESSTNIPTSQSSSSNKSISTNKKSDTAKVTKTSTKVPTTSSMTTAKKGDKKDKSEQQTSNGTDISPTSKMHKIPQAKLQVPAAVVGRKTESKTGLSQPQQQSQTKTSTSVSTSIPKPMAAIKGTSKAIESEKQPDDLIKEKVSISVTSEKTQIVNPLHNHQLINGSNDIAIVNDQSLPASDIYRDTTNNIYQMQSHTNSIASRKLENFNDPLLINGNKFGMVQTTIFEEDKEGTAQAIVPMRSLMRGFNNHMSSPSRMNRTTINGTGYYDENGQGYCSDGDAFRKSTIRYSDIENGYLSEGPHFLSILRNRPQMPTTIAEERCQSSREGNLDNTDMESNSSKNSNRDYWSSQQAPSPTSSRKDKTSSPSHSRRSTPSTKSSNRTKGVPQNFGYIKRTNGSSTATEMQTNALLAGGRTTHVVSAVPRTNKLKVSGGTQTSTADFQQKLQNPQYRSFSLTGQGAAQLSASVKERFGSHSLPKGGLDMHVFQQRMANRGSAKLNDGSLSDTQTYVDVKPEYNSYAMWLKHNGAAGNRLSEGDSLESVSIVSSPGLSRNSKLIQQSRDSVPSTLQTGQNSKLNRSNSIRSTKSEKMYPSMLSRGPEIETEPYYCLPVSAQGGTVAWSQPTSPQPTPSSRGFTGLLSPTHNASHRLTYPKKNDEVHGSQISLMSGGSSMYGSTTEEQRQANEVRRLKRELIEAREQVMSLSSQLSTNVSFFFFLS